MGFQRRLESSESCRVAKRDRELIPDYRGLMGEGALTIGFSAIGWYTEGTSISRGTKLTGGGVQMEEVRDVRGCKTVGRLKT